MKEMNYKKYKIEETHIVRPWVELKYNNSMRLKLCPIFAFTKTHHNLLSLLYKMPCEILWLSATTKKQKLGGMAPTAISKPRPTKLLKHKHHNYYVIVIPGDH